VPSGKSWRFFEIDFVLYGKNLFHAIQCFNFNFIIELKTSTFIASHNSSQHVTSLLNQLVKVQQHGLSVQSFLERHKEKTNLPVLQISFQNFIGRLLK
jgi:hypothetical protein